MSNDIINRSKELEQFLDDLPNVIFDVIVHSNDLMIKFNIINVQAKQFFLKFLSEDQITNGFHIKDLVVSGFQQEVIHKEVKQVFNGKTIVVKNREFLLTGLNNEQIVIDASYKAELVNGVFRVKGIVCEKSKVIEKAIPKSKMDYYKTIEEEVENLKEFFETFDALIMILNEEGRILFVSPNVGNDILYKSRDEILGRKLDDIFSKGQADFFMAYHKDVFQKGQCIDFEYHLPINNKVKWFQCRIIPVMIKDGKYMQNVAIIRDISKWRIKPLKE